MSISRKLDFSNISEAKEYTEEKSSSSSSSTSHGFIPVPQGGHITTSFALNPNHPGQYKPIQNATVFHPFSQAKKYVFTPLGVQKVDTQPQSSSPVQPSFSYSSPQRSTASDPAFSTPIALNRPVGAKLEQKTEMQLTQDFKGIYNTDPLERSFIREYPNARIYQVKASGENFPVVRQPSQFGCGAACMLMVLPNAAQMQLTNGQWYSSVEQASAATMRTKLHELGQKEAKWIAFKHPDICNDRDESKNDDEVVKPDKSYQTKNGSEVVAQIKELLSDSTHSLILGTTNKEIEGHWVVINRLADDLFLLRDPYTGLAGTLKGEQLAKYLLVDGLTQENAILI